MDTSGTYSKMCYKAQEIQKIWELRGGDFYVNPKRKDKSFLVILGGWLNSRTAFEGFNQYNYVWLPRQDQLQGMLEGDIEDKWDNCNNFWRFIESPITSFEQLWLAFVMKEKYKKQWDVKKGAWTRR